jgi:DNA-binding MarR family transcriptional regulator
MSTKDRDLRERREHILLRMLLRASQTMNAETFRRLAERGFADAQPSFTRLLGNLDTEGTRIGAIARRMGTTRQAASQLLNEVTARGFVVREDDPEDRRGVVVRFTPRGRRMLEEAVEVMTEIEGEYEQVLGAKDYARLKALLRKLVDGIDPQGGLGLD